MAGPGAERAAGDGAGQGGPGPSKARQPEQPEPQAPPVCSVAMCPICMVVTALGDARPDLMEHLLLAGREMLLAMRALIDARLQGISKDEPEGLQRITIT